MSGTMFRDVIQSRRRKLRAPDNKSKSNGLGQLLTVDSPLSRLNPSSNESSNQQLPASPKMRYRRNLPKSATREKSQKQASDASALLNLMVNKQSDKPTSPTPRRRNLQPPRKGGLYKQFSFKQLVVGNNKQPAQKAIELTITPTSPKAHRGSCTPLTIGNAMLKEKLTKSMRKKRVETTMPTANSLQLRPRVRHHVRKWPRMRLKRKPALDCWTDIEHLEEKIDLTKAESYIKEVAQRREEAEVESSDSESEEEEDNEQEMIDEAFEKLSYAYVFHCDDLSSIDAKNNSSGPFTMENLRDILLASSRNIPSSWAKWIENHDLRDEIWKQLDTTEEEKIEALIQQFENQLGDDGCPCVKGKVCQTMEGNIDNKDETSDSAFDVQSSLRFLFSVVTNRRNVVYTALFKRLRKICGGKVTVNSLASAFGVASDSELQTILEVFDLEKANEIDLEEFVIISSLREHLETFNEVTDSDDGSSHLVCNRMRTLLFKIQKFKKLFAALSMPKGAIVKTPEISPATIESMLFAATGWHGAGQHEISQLVMATLDTERRGGIGSLDFFQHLPFFATLHQTVVGLCCPLHLHNPQ